MQQAAARRVRPSGLGIALLLVLTIAPVAEAAKRKPINATVTVDPSRAVSAQITAAAGGKVAVTAANATRITVTIPAGAVLADTLVTATPVTRLASRSLRRGLLAGVQLQPEGLVLLKPAAVRFARRGKARKGKRLVFVGSEGTGRDVYRLPPPVRVRRSGKRRTVSLTGAPVVSIAHFSTVEGFDWSTATVARLDAINRPAVALHAFSQELSRLFAERPPDWDAIEEAHDRTLKRFILPLMSRATAALGGSCSEAAIPAAKRALTSALSFKQQADILGVGTDGLDEAVPELLVAVARCMTTLCPKLGDPRLGAYFASLARQLALMGIGNEAFFVALYENMIRCGAFEVHVDSLIDETLEGSHFTIRVDGRAKYVPSLDFPPPPPPRGPLTYVSTSGSGVVPCHTYEITSTTDGEFELSEVRLGAYDPDNPSQNLVLAMRLKLPVVPMENYHYRSTPTQENCGTDTYDQPASIWQSGFQFEHFDFQDLTAYHFPGVDFVRDAAPKFARAVYSPNTKAVPGGQISENTLIEIIHTPQPPLPLPDPNR